MSVQMAVADGSATCVPQSEMREIAQNFRQFKSLADRGEYCFDGSQTSHLIAGIMFMRKTQFSAAMPKSGDELFSGTFATNWYEYFIGRIDEFQIPANCPKGVGAYVYFFGNTMYVCPMLLTDNFTAMDRASVFMHEARHIDGFPHVTCSRGPRRGLNGACDSSIQDHGSYGVTVETYAQLSRYAGDLHPALRAYARAAATTYADEAFETPVNVARKEQLLLMTTNKELHALNPKTAETLQLGSAPALGVVVMRAQHMILFPEDRTLQAKYMFARSEGDIQQAAGDIAVEYNNQTPAIRANLLDVHIATQWSAQVYPDKVRLSCNPRAEGYQDVALPDGERAKNLIYPNGYDRAATQINLTVESGKILEIGCRTTSDGYVRLSTLNFDQPYKRMQKVGSDVIGLTTDGRLFRVENGKSVALQTALDGKVYEMVPNSHVDFFDSNQDGNVILVK